MRICFLIMCSLLWFGCYDQKTETSRGWAKNYYDSYAKKDLDRWIEFYDENSEIHDITTGIVMKSRDSILTHVSPVFTGVIPFYRNIKWNIHRIVADGHRVSVKGSVSNAYHNNQILPAWDFISLIEFNAKGQIIKQYDFVDYTNLD